MLATGRKTTLESIHAEETVWHMQNIGDALKLARDLGLQRADAEILLSAHAQISRASIVAFPERAIASEIAFKLQSDFAERARGVPVAYLLGEREFFGLRLKVSKDVLIPRPDTESLVEVLLALDVARDCAMLDLGTGSGAIALAAKANRPAWGVHASDQSSEALEIAKYNALQLGLEVCFMHGTWFEPWANQRFDVIAANPPYIAACDAHLQQGDLRFEPMAALAAGGDGLSDLHQIISKAAKHLHSGGWLVLEHGYDQAKAVAGLLHAAGFANVQHKVDLGGHDRVSFGQIH
jgi:release factor glutamine methyltransferase